MPMLVTITPTRPRAATAWSRAVRVGPPTPSTSRIVPSTSDAPVAGSSGWPGTGSGRIVLPNRMNRRPSSWRTSVAARRRSQRSAGSKPGGSSRSSAIGSSPSRIMPRPAIASFSLPRGVVSGSASPSSQAHLKARAADSLRRSTAETSSRPRSNRDEGRGGNRPRGLGQLAIEPGGDPICRRRPRRAVATPVGQPFSMLTNGCDEGLPFGVLPPLSPVGKSSPDQFPPGQDRRARVGR